MLINPFAKSNPRYDLKGARTAELHHEVCKYAIALIYLVVIIEIMKSQIVSFLAGALVLLSLPSRGQGDYIVTIKGDTLFGRTNIQSYDKLDRVQLITDSDKSTYTALQAKSVSSDGKLFHAMAFDQSIQFMQVIKSGFLSLYGYRVENQNGYNGRFLYKKDGRSLDVPNIKFRAAVVNFLSDCDEAAQRVESRELKKDDIEQIVDVYNSCMDNKTTARFANTVDENEIKKKLTAVTNLLDKVQESKSLPAQQDAIDLLKDIRTKIETNKNIPNYQIEALKEFLGKENELKSELSELLEEIKN